jgi:PIN domain nuclease of toxin-antitoxin system
MRVLLDTHTFLWFILNDSQLSVPATTLIADPANAVYLSPASYWELAIKVSLGKYALSQPYQPFVESQIAANRFTVLAIEPRHTAHLISSRCHIITGIRSIG